MWVTDEVDLAEALAGDIAEIRVEGELAQRVGRIRAARGLGWTLARSAIGAGAGGLLLVPLLSIPLAAIAGLVAFAVLGRPATLTAGALALVSGGLEALDRLRRYQERTRSDRVLVLRRPWVGA